MTKLILPVSSLLESLTCIVKLKNAIDQRLKTLT